VNASGSDYLHAGWCMTQTHTAGTCTCHYGEIVKLRAELEVVKAREEAVLHALNDWPAIGFEMAVRNAMRRLAASGPPGTARPSLGEEGT